MTEQEASRQLAEFINERDPARTEVSLSPHGGLSFSDVKVSLSEMKTLYRRDDLELSENQAC